MGRGACVACQRDDGGRTKREMWKLMLMPGDKGGKDPNTKNVVARYLKYKSYNIHIQKVKSSSSSPKDIITEDNPSGKNYPPKEKGRTGSTHVSERDGGARG